MERLSYAALKNLGYDGYLMAEGPERVLQFGEGNFLRAFVDYFFDVLNEKCGFNGKIVVVQPRSKEKPTTITEQNGLYTLYLRGIENGEKINRKRVISAISRCINLYTDFKEFIKCASNPSLRYIVSNTTEAGIVFDASCKFEDEPPSSFPGKLTRFLYERYLVFGKKKGKGFVILPCELINNNGHELKNCVEKYINLWELGSDFLLWVREQNTFCSTLVDRIVTGYPKAESNMLNEENGYVDDLIDTGEPFGFWAIEGPQWLEKELPFKQAGLPVAVVADHTPYKTRKVRILNGAHTSIVLAAYLSGKNIVRECMQDDVIRDFMHGIVYDEIIPTLMLPKKDLEEFAGAVEERFCNPYIDHALLSISLNSTSKWKSRCLPSLKAYFLKRGKLPEKLVFSLAAYIAFYSYDIQRITSEGLICRRSAGDEYTVKDSRAVLELFYSQRTCSDVELTQAVLSAESLWGEKLTDIQGLSKAVAETLSNIRKKGAYEAMKEMI